MASWASRPGLKQGLLCRRLFRFFLAASGSSADHLSVDADFHFKELVMVRSRLSNDRIGWKAIETSLTPLLNLRFIIILPWAMTLARDL